MNSKDIISIVKKLFKLNIILSSEALPNISESLLEDCLKIADIKYTWIASNQKDDFTDQIYGKMIWAQEIGKYVIPMQNMCIIKSVVDDLTTYYIIDEKSPVVLSKIKKISKLKAFL